MTPVGNVDVAYLKDMVDKGRISCHKAPLTVPATTPIGCKPLLTQQQIDRMAENWLPIDREARLTGSMDVSPHGIIFDAFSPDMISSAPVPAGGDYKFAVGIDHGHLPGTQIAVLVCIDMKDIQAPRVYVLGETVGGGNTPEHVAQSILDMLQTHSIDPALCTWTGDQAHYATRDRRAKKMSNGVLMRAFERILSLAPKTLPFTIRTAVKHRHSVYFGASMIHAIQSRKHFYIRPECEKTIKSIQRWTMKRSQSDRSRDPYQHCIDSLRYAILPIIDYRFKPPAKIRIL